VPSATSGDFRPRVVVDEASFDFRELPDAAAEVALEQFNESLEALRDDRQVPAVCSLYAYVECRDGMELHNLLYSRATEVDPDVCRRTGLLLDRCPAWDDDAPAGCEPLDLPETPIVAFSVGFAFEMALSSRAVGCLVVPSCPRRDFRRLSRESSAADVLFFAEALEARRVWRHAYAVEDVAEHEFFAVAAFAFPSLVFHPGLQFGKFDGSYAAVRDPVVRILSALDDHFPRVLAERQGLPSDIAAAMGQYGVDLSPESPNTRRSEALMRKREVAYSGITYRCEWHAKIERHRNRIHFTLPTGGPGGCVLIGIFAEHLDV